MIFKNKMRNNKYRHNSFKEPTLQERKGEYFVKHRLENHFVQY